MKIDLSNKAKSRVIRKRKAAGLSHEDGQIAG